MSDKITLALGFRQFFVIDSKRFVIATPETILLDVALQYIPELSLIIAEIVLVLD